MTDFKTLLSVNGNAVSLVGHTHNYQPIDAELTALAGLTSAADKLPYFTGSGTAALADLTSFIRTLLDDANAAAAQTTLGLVIGTNVQAQDAELSAIAGLTSAANKLPYFTGSGTASLADLSAFGRSLIDDADATAAQTTLGLVIGTNVQAQDAELQAIAGLVSIADRLPYFTGSGTASLATFTSFGRTLAALADASAGRTALGLVIGTDVQAQDAELAALAGLTSAADRLPYFTGSGTAALAIFSAFARTLIDDADATTMRTTLGLVIGTNVQAQDAELSAIAGLTSTADALPYFTGVGTAAVTTLTTFVRTLLDDVDATTARTTLGLAIGTNVQAQDAELQALAGLTSAADALPYFTGSGTASVTTLTSFIRTLLDDANAAAAQTTLGLVIGTNVQAQDAELSAIAGLTSAADSLPYFTGSGTAALTTLSAFARTLIDDADAATMRTTLGLISGGAGDIWVKKAGDTMTGNLSLSNTLTLSQGTQDYVFGSVAATVLELQSKTAATPFTLRMFTNDGDGTDIIEMSLWGKGLPASITNRERLIMYWDVTNSWYSVAMDRAGTGVARQLHLYSNANTSQFVLETDGNVGFNTSDIESFGGVSSPSYAGLQLGTGAAIMYHRTARGLWLIDNAYFDGTTWRYRVGAASPSSMVTVANGKVSLSYIGNGAADAAITYNIGLDMIVTGEIGIGVTPIAGWDLDVVLQARSRGLFMAKNVGTFGSLKVNTGTSTLTGYLSWHLPHVDSVAGTRLGYMGASSANILLALENSAVFQVTGGVSDFTANGIVLDSGTTLTHYEEGTWTPTLTFGGASVGITYSTRSGKFTRIGNMVHVSCVMVLTSKGTSVGTSTINGLPYAAAATYFTPYSVQWANTATSYVNMLVLLTPSTTSANFIGITAAATIFGSVSNTDIANNTTFRFSFSYLV